MPIDIDKKIQTILQNIEFTHELGKFVDDIKPYLIHFRLSNKITETEFYKITSLLSPQSRSALWQNYFIDKHGLIKIPPNDNRGDFIKDNLYYYEYKASGFNQDGALHIVQIRDWQQCGYIIQKIMIDRVYTFELTKEEMKEELIACKAQSAHGTKQANEGNQNIEKRLTIVIDSDHWRRWLEKYSRPYWPY